jgi:hypothetical protein
MGTGRPRVRFLTLHFFNLAPAPFTRQTPRLSNYSKELNFFKNFDLRG